MPIYEYRCSKCGREFEAFQKVSDPALETCDVCRGPVAKIMSLSAFHLKGTGWYVTDYGGKKSVEPPAKKTDGASAAAPPPAASSASPAAPPAAASGGE